ncbi:glycerophosphoryl diester phosphodiesterase [Nakamurella sp. UYEF19]|uniref:glycerophosphodiester phosphodiesterase n=1 Tax=Nakamurella sp. UYEF19 TaxID=1756392 RepID=UPI003396126B
MTGVSRRAALGLFGIGATGIGVGAGVLIDRSSGSVNAAGAGQAAAASTAPVTVASWAATRGDRYYIGHRGSGDVYPEHSLEAYLGALAGGAACLEISVGMTSDGVLVCMHDPTYDRTTTAKGIISALPSTVLRGIRLSLPQLGPAWAADPTVQVPLLEDVLRAVGGRAVLCLEAKNGNAFPAVLAAVQAHGLKNSVMIKLGYNSARIAKAKAAGYPVFAYFGATADVTADRIKTLAGQLDRTRDCLVIPTLDDDNLVKTAVETGIPVWAFAVHRRSEAAHFFALGCKGIVASSLKYVSTAEPSATADTWSFGAIAPGEMTKDPSSAAYAPTWSEDEMRLGAKGSQHFLTLGQLGPVAAAAASYTVEFESSWPTLPGTTDDNMSLVFGHADDAYYQHRSGLGTGYHAILRANGSLELFRHQDGQPDGVQLGSTAKTPAPTAGQWMKFRLSVTPSDITWARTDVAGATISASDRTVRGGYLHLGRSSTDGVLAFRGLSVS